MSRPRRDQLRARAETAGLDVTAGPLDQMRWRVPQLISPAKTSRPQEGDVFEWAPRGGEWRTPTRELLLRFAELTDAPPATLRRFARRWGPLHLCAHGLPRTHLPGELPYQFREIPDCRLMPPRESLQSWRRYTSMAAAIIHITATLKNNTSTHPSEWEPFRPFLEIDEPLEANVEFAVSYTRDSPRTPVLITSQRAGIESMINWWLRTAAIGPSVDWDTGLSLVGPGTLFGALAVQLAALVHAERHIALCAVCGKFFVATRKPQTGRLAYCSKKDCNERGRRRISYRNRTDASS